MKHRKRDRKIKHITSRGFTFLEIIVVIIIMAIVAVIALPNYTRMMQRSDIARSARSFESALNSARQHAYDSGRPVSICMVADVTSTAGQACSAWSQSAPSGDAPGWVVFSNTTDDGTTDTVDANEKVFNRFQVSGDRTTVKWNNGTMITLSQRSGTTGNAGTMTAFSPALGDDNGATVRLSPLGKVTYTPPK